VGVFLFAELIALERVLAAVEDDVGSEGIDVHVAVLGTDGAVAIPDLHCGERGEFDFVADGCAVAVGFVPDFWGGGHGGCGCGEVEVLSWIVVGWMGMDMVVVGVERLRYYPGSLWAGWGLALWLLGRLWNIGSPE